MAYERAADLEVDTANHLDVQGGLVLGLRGLVGANDVGSSDGDDLDLALAGELGEVLGVEVLTLELDDVLRGVHGRASGLGGQVVEGPGGLDGHTIGGVRGTLALVQAQMRDGEGGDADDHLDNANDLVGQRVRAVRADDLAAVLVGELVEASLEEGLGHGDGGADLQAVTQVLDHLRLHAGVHEMEEDGGLVLGGGRNNGVDLLDGAELLVVLVLGVRHLAEDAVQGVEIALLQREHEPAV